MSIDFAGLPSIFPLARAVSSPARVRSEMRARSCSAIHAKIDTINSPTGPMRFGEADEIDTGSLQRAKVIERGADALTGEAIERPNQNGFELPLTGVGAQCLKLFAVSRLRTLMVDVFLCHLPGGGIGELPKLNETRKPGTDPATE